MKKNLIFIRHYPTPWFSSSSNYLCPLTTSGLSCFWELIMISFTYNMSFNPTHCFFISVSLPLQTKQHSWCVHYNKFNAEEHIWTTVYSLNHDIVDIFLFRHCSRSTFKQTHCLIGNASQPEHKESWGESLKGNRARKCHLSCDHLNLERVWVIFTPTQLW